MRYFKAYSLAESQDRKGKMTNQENFGDAFIKAQRNKIRWQDKDIYFSLDYETSEAFNVDIELVSVDQHFGPQYLRMKKFFATIEYEGKKENGFLLEAHPNNLRKVFSLNVVPEKNKKKRDPYFRIYNSWYSTVQNASFNPDETEHYGTGNSAMLIKENISEGEYLVGCNSGLHPLSEIPKFEDIVFRIKFTPFFGQIL